MDALSALKVDNANRTSRSRQESKLKHLLSQKENANNGNDAKKVVNISSHELNHSELSMLNKGFFVLKMDPVVDPKRRRQAVNSTVVLPTNYKQISHHRNLNEQIFMI